MFSLPIKIKYTSPEVKRIEMPRTGDLGIDFYANEDALLYAQDEPSLIGTGVCLQLPPGYALILKDRSSNSKSYHVLAGVIDNNYRGEIKVRVKAVRDTFHISKGDKVVQGILVKDLNSKFFLKEVEELSDSNRGILGFGSTGK